MEIKSAGITKLHMFSNVIPNLCFVIKPFYYIILREYNSED